MENTEVLLTKTGFPTRDFKLHGKFPAIRSRLPFRGALGYNAAFLATKARMNKNIHLIRHGEPETGFTRRFLGRLDPCLSPEGIAQAKTVADKVRLLEPGRIFTSPLRRAKETADIIARACGMAAEVNPLLLEINFGQLEGLTFKEASAVFPGVTDSWQALAGDFSFPGGENFRDFDRRCEEAAQLARACPEETVVLVAHGGVLRGILCHLLAIRADGPLRFRLAYAALTTVVVGDDEDAVLTGFNVGRSLAELHPKVS